MLRDPVKFPRSKGCRMCVQRRVKCDQTRPSCHRCKIGNRPCPGYGINVKFLDESQKVRDLFEEEAYFGSEQYDLVPPLSWTEPALETSQQNVPKRSNTPPRLLSNSDEEELRGSEKVFISSTDHMELDSTCTAFEANKFFDMAIWRAIFSPSLEQSQILQAFVVTIASLYPSPAIKTIRNYGTWLQLVATQGGRSITLDSSLRAVALSYLGRQTRDKSLVQASRQQYGKALLQLNAALQTNKEGLADETLCSIVLLGFYELLNCTTKGSWIQHAGGISRLLRLRGPERHRTGLGKATFFACRNTLMMEAYTMRIPCFLNEPAWRKLSRTIREDEQHQSPFQIALEEFFDESIKHPAYFQRARVVQKHRNPFSRLPEVIQEGKEHRLRFKAVWLRVLVALKSEGLLAVDRPSRQGDPVFPFIYEFGNVSVGSLYSAYWTGLTVFNNLIMDLECHMVNCQTRSGMFTTFGVPSLMELDKEHEQYRVENIVNAENICRSTEDMAGRPFLGSAFHVFALRAALQVLKSNEQHDWIEARLERLSQKIGIAQFASFDLLSRNNTLDYGLVQRSKTSSINQ